MPNADCLYSTVRNTSGVRRHFGFLPPKGKTLTANEEYSVLGDITTIIAMSRQSYASGRRMQLALDRAIEAGELEIVKSPALFIKDSVTDETKQVVLNSGSLAVEDPCWASSSSSSSSSSA